MRQLITTTVFVGTIVLGLSGIASAGDGFNGGSLQGGNLNGGSYQGGNFNGGGYQGGNFNGGGTQGDNYNGGSFQGDDFNGPGFQGNGLGATAIPDDIARYPDPPESDTIPDVRTRISVPRHGLHLNGVILADPAASGE